jgi:eukaryotic-like serine/threonine-protein kinase
MGLTPGTRIGPYDVVSMLGAGGMGEVYKARDTRLDRTVAVKVLTPQLAADPQFRDRFEREARAISQLTHPRICTLYDVGEHNHTAFLVMEHVEGKTLADRLKKGPLPIDLALQYGIEIAAALDAAHCHGIIHRDLKLANMLTKTGIKLLDFGLAKTQATGAVNVLATATPTITAPLTAQGSILGTVQYMAPEQLEVSVFARHPVIRFTIPMSGEQVDRSGPSTWWSMIALPPDGTHLAYVADMLDP